MSNPLTLTPPARESLSVSEEAALQYSAFISHASADRERAEEICASLEARGFRCWIAPRDIRAGFEYGDEIVRGIEHSRCMVVVLSEAANESHFVRREVERAVSKKKPVFPVRIEEVLPSPGLELFISATHWIDAWGGMFTQQLDRLARDLSGFSPAAKPSWRARAAFLRRRAKRAAIKAAVVVAVASVVFAAGWLYMSTRGGQLPATAPDEPAPARQGVPQQPLIVGRSSGVEQPPAETVAVSPPTAPGAVTDGSDPVRAPQKQRALASIPWLHCADWFCSAPSLRSYFAAVRRIAFGESRNRLDRVVEVASPQGQITEQQLQEVRNDYTLDYIPIRPGADSVFVRLDFYDGTSSSVQPARLDRPTRRTHGVALSPVNGPRGDFAPSLYAGFTLGEDSIQFRPEPMPGGEGVMFSFDDGGFFPAPSITRNRPDRGYRFKGLPSGKNIRLEYRGQGGKPVGPFVYDAAPVRSLIMNTMKASLLADLHNLVQCTRVGFEFTERQLKSPPQNDEARRQSRLISSALANASLSFVTRGPIIACHADWQKHGRTTSNYMGDWAAVQEIRFGTRPGKLGAEVKVQLPLADALGNRVPRGQDLVRIWNITLPADAEGVYAQLVFTDRTTSEEFRIQVTELRLPGVPIPGSQEP